MIYGIGIDIVAVKRMQGNIEKYKEQFARKILGDKEMNEYSNSLNSASYLAKRFAAKEALVKALGTGFRNGIYFKDIQIEHSRGGKPEFHYYGKVLDLISSNGILTSHLSLADEQEYACACVILEK